jgi:hypothetical protein
MRLIRSLRSPGLIVAIVAVVLAGVGTATARHLITTRDVRNNSLTGADIRNHSLTPRDFRGSVAGQPGPPGRIGVQGPAGPAGAAGKGTEGLRRVSSAYRLDPQTPNQAVAVACPAGSAAISSGVDVYDEGTKAGVAGAYPTGSFPTATGANAFVTNTTGQTDIIAVVIAVCAPGATYAPEDTAPPASERPSARHLDR